MRSTLVRTLGLVCLAGFLLGALAVVKVGPRFIIGILRYDTRQEGTLKVGDRAPGVELLALDGKTPVPLAEKFGRRPVVLIFGSFT